MSNDDPTSPAARAARGDDPTPPDPTAPGQGPPGDRSSSGKAPYEAKSVPIISVRGGSEGFAAHYAEMTQLARTVDHTSSDLLHRAGLGAKVMTNSDLVESAILAPVTFAKAEAAVVLATTGPSGLTVEGGTLKIDAFLLRVTVGAYQDVDALQHAAMKAFDYTTGFQLGLAAPALAIGGALAYATASPAQRTAMTAAIQGWVAKHPGALEHVIDGGGGLLDGLGVWEKVLAAPLNRTGLDPWRLLGFGTFHPTVSSAAKDLAGLYQDGEPHVSALESVGRIDAQQPPRNVQDLMQRLDETNAVKTEGYVRVQTITVDGVKKYIAYIPGTDDMTTKPFGSDSTIRDMGANLKLVGGDNTAYGRGVVEAINKATAGDPNAHVMMVGHSQGGMTAMKLAAMGSGESGAHFTIDHVVTAGSPNAQVPDLPNGTDALSLENNSDAVPLTDGEPNPDAINRTTVRFDSPGPTIADNHMITHYIDGAAAVDKAAAAHPNSSIGTSVDSLRSYLSGQQVRTDSVVITRVTR